MHIVNRLEDIPGSLAQAPGAAVTIGNFDGVHLGHQRLITRTVRRARERGLASVVLTFDPHPMRFFSGKKTPPFITLLDQKLELMAALGPDCALVLPFTRQLADMTPEAFAEHVLARGLGTKELFIGYDYAFGKNRAGDYATLSRLGEKLGFAVERLEPVMAGGAVVSSTRIRDLVQGGNVWEARELLGRFFQVRGTVVRGAGRGGSLLGFPTANISPVDELLPKPGVYATFTELDPPTEGLLPAMTNIGVNPTFGGEELSVEAHLLDHAENLYGRDARLHFVQRIRDEKRFSGPEELAARIAEDVRLGKAILASAAKP